MKKIAVVCTLYGPHGGTGRVTTEIMERYAADGNEVHVFCPECDERFLENSAVTCLHKLKVTNIGVLKQLDLLLKASIAVKPKDYDIVYATGDYHIKPDIVTIHTLKKYGRKTIEALEKTGELEKTTDWIKDLLRKVYCPLIFELGEQFVYRRSNTKFICVSAGVKRNFCDEFHADSQKVAVIPNAISFEEYSYKQAARDRIRQDLCISESQKVVLFVGSDWKRKRLDTAIKVISNFPQLLLIVAGHDDPVSYQELAKKLGCNQRVLFVGFRNDINDFYSAADYFLFTSVYETFGLVALEAMAAGLVVISNKLNGVEDYIENGVNGYLTENASEEAFTDVFRQILSSKELEFSIKNNATITAKMNNWDNCYMQYKQIFDTYQRGKK